MKRLGAGLIALLVLGPTVRGGQDPAERSPTAAKDGRGAVGADAAPTPDAVRRAPLRFPADRAIGVLYTRARAARDWPGRDWERLGEATGEVAIPPGRQVRLDLGAGAGADLAPLRRLGPDDLRSLRIRDLDLRGEDLAALAHLTGLEEVDLPGCPIGDEGARHLAGLSRLRSLALGGCRVGDEGLAKLAALPQLERLDLDDCWVTEAGLAHVGRMQSLRALSLYRTDVDAKGLARLRGLTGLESLRLAYGLNVTDAGLAHLAGLDRLKDLDLESCPITDAGLAHLSGLEQLESLNLPGTKITDAGLAHLRGLRSLHRLSLPRGMSDEALAHVGAIRSLRVLIVRPGRVTDRGIAALSTLDRLQDLNLGSGPPASRVTDAAAAHLARLPALEKLWLQNTEIGDAGLEALTGSRSLSRLYLGGNRVTSEGLRHLAGFRTLTYLHLAGIRGPAGSLRHLGPLMRLTELSVDGRGWLDAGADAELVHLARLSRLESLTLTLPLSDAGMRHLAGLTSLRRLVLDHKSNRLTDEGLACVAGMESLAFLRVSGRITERGLVHLEGLPALYYARLDTPPGAIDDRAAATLRTRNPAIRVLDYPRWKEDERPPPAVGQAAPDLKVDAFDGRKVRVGELKGKVVLLYFWATWCSPCLAETPRIKAFVEARRGRGESFEALSLSLDEDAHWARRHAERHELGWPQAWVGRESPSCSAYAVTSAPHYVVIGPDGKIAYAGGEFSPAGKAVDDALRRPIPGGAATR